MASNEVNWIKAKYQEVDTTESEGPSAAKKVKFSDIEDDVSSHFPSSSHSRAMISHFVKQAFPNAEHKKMGKQRQTYVLGIEAVPETSTRPLQVSTDSQPLQQEVEKLQQELCCSKEVTNLQDEVGEYKRKLAAMQQEVAELRASSVSPSLLQSQMQVALHPSNIVYSGPSTIKHFQSFSVQGVISELKRHAPDVYKLIAALGTTHTLDSEGEDRETRLSDLRCVTSLCAMLKNRSMKVLGIQLLITFMLIARATSKQVRE